LFYVSIYAEHGRGEYPVREKANLVLLASLMLRKEAADTLGQAFYDVIILRTEKPFRGRIREYVKRVCPVMICPGETAEPRVHMFHLLFLPVMLIMLTKPFRGE
jgi:hypothetical protein